MLLSVVLAFSGLLSFAQEQPEAPRFNGADVQYFMRRLVGEFGEVVEERQIAAETLSPQVAVAFEVSADGSVGEWRFRDRNSDSIYVVTSPYARYASRNIPRDTVDLTGILLYGKAGGSRDCFILKMRTEDYISLH